ncbi:anaerobic ribonucleoside-triphosphate reductase [Paraoerskovia marina]|uniref:anaerobic ribonucleoside-triphosphate reductase n=1 Tax=Paraoerskovia marina TaxID=545619 RepID=UPI00069329F7|nr:anaerobic ribonucleoside-triphosphate reductase [Paraoerskovia marina]
MTVVESDRLSNHGPVEGNASIVTKRDGRRLAFDSARLARSVRAATESCDPRDADVAGLVDSVVTRVGGHGRTEIAVADIREAVMQGLVAAGLAEAAAAYERRWVERAADRAASTSLETALDQLDAGRSTVVNENANKDSNVFNTRRDLTAGAVGKVVGLGMMPPHVANAHQKGDIHYHDLDYHPYSPMTNCCLIDFTSMLGQGFRIGNAEVESPRSIGTATAQIAQIIANVSSSQYGGCSVDRIDELLAPYAAKNLAKHRAEAERWVSEPERREEYAQARTRKDVYDAMQSLEYEINTLFTSNGQTPFTSLGLGLGAGPLEREIQRAILQVRIDGLGAEHRTAIFPKLIFSLRRGLNLEPTDPNYDIKQLAVECSTRRMYPDVLNYDKIVEITGSFKTPMGCRSFLPSWTDPDGNEVVDGRMNLGVVTLNLPRVALEADGSLERFWSLLDERLETVHDALVYRIARCTEAVPGNAPILYRYGAFGRRLGPHDAVDELFRDGRATVSLGYIGLYEVATAFFGGAWESDPAAKALTLDVVRRLAEAAEAWTRTHGYRFSVYATPSESLTDRFCRLDTARFGAIPDITDKGYYTNSFHYDVRKNPTPFEKLDFEHPYPQFSSGGFIHYCEYPVLEQNPSALEAVWDYAYDRVGYLGTNTPIDRCYACGFSGDFTPTARGFACPGCGNDDPRTCDVVKRTCGYLGNPQARPMVQGRHAEISARVKHLDAAAPSPDAGPRDA